MAHRKKARRWRKTNSGEGVPSRQVMITIYDDRNIGKSHSKRDKWKITFSRIDGNVSGYDVDTVLENIKSSIKREEASFEVGWNRNVLLFSIPKFRRMLLLGVMTAVAREIIGIFSFQSFNAFILYRSGFDSIVAQSLALIILGMLKLIVNVIAGILFDIRGRRFLLSTSLGGVCAYLTSSNKMHLINSR